MQIHEILLFDLKGAFTMGYSTGDKLAIALACLAGVMAIILFLLEKTPVTMILLLSLMDALAVYPILHFVKGIGGRIAVFTLFIIGTLLFGWRAMPRSHSISVSNQETKQPQQEPQQLKSEEKNPAQKQKPKPTGQQGSQATRGNGNASGNVNQNGDNNTSVIGNNNSVGNTYNSPIGLSGWLIPRSDPTPTVKCLKYDQTNHTLSKTSEFEIPEDYVAVIVGSDVFIEKRFPITILQIADQPRLVLDRIDGKVSVSLDIFDSDPNPRIIAKIENNKFTVNPNNYFKSEPSSDGSRLRVIDQHDIEVLNVDFFNGRSLRIRAVLYFPGIQGPLRITNEKTTFEDHELYNYCVEDSIVGVPVINIYPSKIPPQSVVAIMRD